MEFIAPLTSYHDNKVNILMNIPSVIAYSILMKLNEIDLMQVRRTCPSWKMLLDNNQFWELKLLQDNLNVKSVATSSNIKEFKSYFRPQHHGIFKYFNKLKWNWGQILCHQVNLHPNIVEVFYIDEEAVIYQHICDNNEIQIANPATGQVLRRILSLHMGAIIRLKKSGKYIVIEDELHKLTSYNCCTNTILSHLQGSNRLTHLKMYHNIVVTRTAQDSTFYIWDASNGRIECQFYDNSANVNVDFANFWIATDNLEDRRVRIWKLTNGELAHATHSHSTAIMQVLIRDYLLIVVECSGRISIKYWMEDNYMDREIVFYGRPNSKIRRLDANRFAYIQLDKVFHIQNTYTGNCLQIIRTQNYIEKIKSNSQYIFVLCRNRLNLYGTNDYTFLQTIYYPFNGNTVVFKCTESKLLFHEKQHSQNSFKQVCLYNFSPRSLSEHYF